MNSKKRKKDEMEILLDTLNEDEMKLLENVLFSDVIESVFGDEKKPKYIYHYTSPQGMKGILENKSLWFTHYKFLNDKSEKQYTYELLKECVEKKKDSLKEGFYQELSECIYQQENNGDTWHLYNGIYKIPDYYVASFSRNSDSLSLWNYYTKNANGTGYNIKLNLNSLRKTLENRAFKVYKINYNKTSQKQLIMQCIDTFNQEWDDQRSNNYLKVLITLLWEIIDVISIGFKHEAFKEEKEFRIVYCIDDKKTPQIKFREMNGIVVPYLDVCFDKKSVAGIMISPTQQDELAKEGVRRLLSYNGFDNVNKEKITVSEVPLRY